MARTKDPWTPFYRIVRNGQVKEFMQSIKKLPKKKLLAYAGALSYAQAVLERKNKGALDGDDKLAFCHLYGYNILSECPLKCPLSNSFKYCTANGYGDSQVALTRRVYERLLSKVQPVKWGRRTKK